MVLKILQNDLLLPAAGPRLIPVGKGRYCYVDNEDYNYLSQFRWFVKMSNSRAYVVRRVRQGKRDSLIRMHREIMCTPKCMHCHHTMFDTFDMRKSHLRNMSPYQHNTLHVERRLRLRDRPRLRRAPDRPILVSAYNPEKIEGTPSEKKNSSATAI